MISNRFRDSLLASTIAATAFFAAAPAWSQTAPAQEEAEPASEDAIVVTGSLIQNPNLVQSSPVAVIGAQEIELRQSNVAEELLRTLPGAVPSIGSAVNNGNGGASYVNLRGLGYNRNLVLLDGARVTPAGLVGAVDLNNIPLALIERVDILTGGASTTYGADAVAGVVNFITKKDFAGFEANVSNQISEQGDGNVFRVDLSTGANFDDGRGNATFSIGYQQSDPIYQGDRDYGFQSIDSYSGRPGGSGTTVPGRFSLPGVGTRQIDPATGALVPTYALFNFNPQNVYQTPFERFNIFGSAHYEVTDGIEVYTQGMYSKNTVRTIIASSGTFGNALEIPYSNPYLPAAARAQFCAANGLTTVQCDAAALATSPTDPNYRTFTSAVSRRFVEAGTRDSVYTTQLFQLRAGVRGSITDTLDFDLYGTYGESENIQRQSGNGLLSRLRLATLATNPNTCLSGGDCVPINLFGPAGSITQEQLDYLVGVTTSGSTNTALSAVRGVITGDFGVASPLASNPIGLAVGGEYRKYSASSISDLATQTPDEVLGNGAASPDTFGRYDVWEAFAEIIAPLVEDAPFAKSLTLELGGRISDYSTAGSKETWKAGGSWEPVLGVKVRGNYQVATRAPNINELFSPPVVGLDNLAQDPCAGAAPTTNANLRAVCIAQGAPANSIGAIQNPSAGQPNVTTGGNPNLDVEKAKTWTVGVVLQPEQVRGLSVTVDYYNIKVTDAITDPTIGDVLAACFDNLTAGSATSVACTQIRRNPLTGGLDGSSATTPGIPLGLSNLGRLSTDGIDLSINYKRDLGFAALALSFDGNWTNSSKFKATPNSINRECVGYYSVNCESIQPEFSWNQRTTLSFDDVDLSLLWRHIDGVKYEPLALEDDGGPDNGPLEQYRSIKAHDYFDLSARFNVSDEVSLTFTVLNLFNKKPPIVGNTIGTTSYNSGNTYPSTYDAIGRRFGAAAKFRF
ncbi:TonB-dependent receptor [Sphingomonas oleivorans]|uniref:TonB-dependent receptor n=1 Tax=Sphingomonas oleivorans TaxID=1735121 RepID=A0A2T5G1M8_9SPHN|nr:TonB-dependent receptor [Sphingomonas oleivorans]PTQ13055.1 TonB-dependent receptor [Sphingomonas oleivorans]